MPRSSSTMRIESIFSHKKAQQKLCCCRQFNHKNRTARTVSFGADVTAVLRHYPLHNREAETGAAVTPRKIGFKQPAEIAWLDSLPRVGNFRTQQTSLRIVTCRYRDPFFTSD